jgi:hypothetical protein
VAGIHRSGAAKSRRWVQGFSELNMPVDNRFRHQEYHRQPSPESWRIVPPGGPLAPTADAYTDRMLAAAHWLPAEGIGTVYLVHGTLAGTDVGGLHREVRRFAPRLAARMGSTWKQLIDMFAGDMGNYTKKYTDLFRQQIDAAVTPPVAVRRFFWTSENHHLGRADAAVQLLVDLSRQADKDRRIMLWGHSHAGNVFAILTNLLGGDRDTRQLFCGATKSFVERNDDGVWRQARALLLEHPSALIDPARLDIVTFGTPVRYGWERRGYGRLLHVVNHRAMEGVLPCQVPFPPTATQLRRVEAGDYFQQMFIAGTNFMPNAHSLRHWKTERRLHLLLQKEVSSRRVWDSLGHGRRVSDDGLTLLIDYAASGDAAATTLAGHAVYTRAAWLPFHLQQIGDWLSATPVE